jgi:hypothetical protein
LKIGRPVIGFLGNRRVEKVKLGWAYWWMLDCHRESSRWWVRWEYLSLTMGYQQPIHKTCLLESNCWGFDRSMNKAFIYVPSKGNYCIQSGYTLHRRTYLEFIYSDVPSWISILILSWYWQIYNLLTTIV